jgi:hypothetical protein
MFQWVISKVSKVFSGDIMDSWFDRDEEYWYDED